MAQAAARPGRRRRPLAGGSSCAACAMRSGRCACSTGSRSRVAPGEIFGLLGPNGSGKSTALRVLTGLLVPDAGEGSLDGAPVAPGGRALRRCMGVVFQAPSLDPRLTARENLRARRGAVRARAARGARALRSAARVCGAARARRRNVVDVLGRHEAPARAGARAAARAVAAGDGRADHGARRALRSARRGSASSSCARSAG